MVLMKPICDKGMDQREDPHRRSARRSAFTIIDVIISMGIIILLFGGIYLVYFSILDAINNIELRTAATSVLESEAEIIRNIPYEQVGTVGGVPSGIIPQEKTIVFDNFNFLIKTTIRNIDDPFDGTLGGTPNDTAPADYKLAEMEISCPDCAKFAPLTFTTTVAPKSLESVSQDGSLFINVLNASGLPVAGAGVHVFNDNVSPTIDLIDATNLNGVLQLVGVPPSVQSYEIDVSLAGYSSAHTYSSAELGGSEPVKPHSTVAAEAVTEISFGIDKVSRVSVNTLDKVCSPFSGVDFSLSGSKLIGVNPDVLKFSTSSVTDSGGAKVFNEIEWDTYSFGMTSSALDVLGTMPFTPVIINPSSTLDFNFILAPARPRSLLVTVKDAVNEGGIKEASVSLLKTGFSEVKVTGHNFLTHTDWAHGEYDSKDGVDTDSVPGQISLELNASSTYTTSTVSWLVSGTIDAGGSTSTFYTLSWNPTTQPPGTGTDSLKFQLASNNDNVTWDFIGPDGTGSSYYTLSGAMINSVHNNNRYLRYQAYLKTDDENFTPSLEDINIEFNGPCVPRAQALFNDLDLGDYTLEVTASGYEPATSSVAITGDWQQTEMLLTSP